MFVVLHHRVVNKEEKATEKVDLRHAVHNKGSVLEKSHPELFVIEVYHLSHKDKLAKSNTNTCL